jgi:hypothetical protein
MTRYWHFVRGVLVQDSRLRADAFLLSQIFRSLYVQMTLTLLGCVAAALAASIKGEYQAKPQHQRTPQFSFKEAKIQSDLFDRPS